MRLAVELSTAVTLVSVKIASDTLETFIITPVKLAQCHYNCVPTSNHSGNYMYLLTLCLYTKKM
jgi:hypothetical protein